MTQILVIGMHRTGTSALTGVLHLCGAYVGDESVLVAANQNNAKGFWERRDVRALNDGLLHDMGCDWHRVSPLGSRQPTNEALAAFSAGSARVVRDLNRHETWVMKEPRFCITLPWWLPQLSGPVCIFTHRHPVEIARSLETRNAFPVPFGLALWERYMERALTATTALPRVTVRYDDLLHHPVEVVTRLLGRLEELGVRGMFLPPVGRITEFIDPGLRRQISADADLESHLTQEQLRLHVDLQDGRALAPGYVHQPNPVSADVLTVFEGAHERFVALRRKYRRRRAEWHAERARLESALAQGLMTSPSVIEPVTGDLRRSRGAARAGESADE